MLHLRLIAVRAVLRPYVGYLDIRNWVILRRHGDVLSIRQIRDAVGGTFCVFHLYAANGLSASVKRALAMLDSLGISVVAVSNLPLLANDEAFLETVTHTIIVRRNIGRDFGGYRTGVLHVLDKLQPDRLMIANDSVFYLSRGLRAFFEELCGPHDYAGVAENHAFGYHVGSYALCFGPRVIGDARFRSFWEKYRLSELRPRVIKHGEIALSRLIIRKLKVNPHVICSATRLAAALRAASVEDLMVSAAHMPTPFPSRQPLQRLKEHVGDWFAGAPAEPVESPSLQAAGAVAGSPPGHVFEMVKSDYRSAIEHEMLDYAFGGSQIHWGSYLLVKLLGCPIIKRDLVIRGVYSVGDLSAFAPLMPPSEFDEFFEMATGRGDPERHWSVVQRMMRSVGYI